MIKRFNRLTEAQTFVNQIMKALADVPTDINLEYKKICSDAATNVGNPVVDNVRSIEKTTRQSPDKTTPWGRSTFPRFSSGHTSSLQGVRNAAMMARNNVFEVVDRVNAFISKAKNAGFSPPSNPFVTLAQHNAHGTFPDAAEAESLTADIKKYVDLLLLERNGKFNVEGQADAVAQLSSVSLSLDGFGGSGNTATDLLNFIPDLDAIRKQKAKDLLATIDFRKRVPRVLFTSSYSPDGEDRGCIVGWKRIPDASGYILKRRNIFNGREEKFFITNQEASTLHSRFKEYVKSWVLSFYDDVTVDSVYYFLDQVPSDGFYTYTVQAYQNFNESKNTFISDTKPVNMTLAVRRQVREQFEKLRAGGSEFSPYPIIAKTILGDEKLDWVLAAVNIRSSILRNDLRSYTRKFGYLGAELDFIFSAMDEGKFVVPKDPGQIATNVSKSISSFGVTQTILETLQETGILYHFDGVDARDAGVVKSDTSIDASSILSTVLSAVDPETMTLDLRSLAANLPSLLEGGNLKQSTRLEKGIITSEKRAEEIVIPDPNPDGDPLQYTQVLDGMRAGVVDLTTFEGLGKLIRTIRVYVDTQAARTSPKSSVVST